MSTSPKQLWQHLTRRLTRSARLGEHNTFPRRFRVEPVSCGRIFVASSGLYNDCHAGVLSLLINLSLRGTGCGAGAAMTIESAGTQLCFSRKLAPECADIKSIKAIDTKCNLLTRSRGLSWNRFPLCIRPYCRHFHTEASSSGSGSQVAQSPFRSPAVITASRICSPTCATCSVN